MVDQPDQQPPQSIWIQILGNTSIQGWIERLIIAAILAYFGTKVNSIHQDVGSTKDIAADTNQTQKAQVAVEVRGTAQDVATLAATTQK